MRKMMVMMAAVAACLALGAAEPAPVKVKNNFPRPAPAALKALKASVGKPFKAGWVFIDGKYIPPPYKVERYGTVLRVNGNQVSGEVIPWSEFIKTQSGVKVSKSEAPAPDPSAAAEPEPEPEPEEDADDAWENSLDDLFDDEPAAKKAAPKKKAAYKPRPKKPAVTVTYTFDGEFIPNEKSNALLARINEARTKLDSHLRAGGLVYFSARYAGVRVDGRAARQMMEKLPDLMKQSTSADALAQAARANGFVYLSTSFLADLFRNRLDYLPLMQRNREEKERTSWQY